MTDIAPTYHSAPSGALAVAFLALASIRRLRRTWGRPSDQGAESSAITRATMSGARVSTKRKSTVTSARPGRSGSRAAGRDRRARRSAAATLLLRDPSKLRGSEWRDWIGFAGTTIVTAGARPRGGPLSVAPWPRSTARAEHGRWVGLLSVVTLAGSRSLRSPGSAPPGTALARAIGGRILRARRARGRLRGAGAAASGRGPTATSWPPWSPRPRPRFATSRE